MQGETWWGGMEQGALDEREGVEEVPKDPFLSWLFQRPPTSMYVSIGLGRDV